MKSLFAVFAAIIALVAAASAQGLQLEKSWNTRPQPKPEILDELARVLSHFAKPAADLAPAPDIKIYGDVNYLMPAKQALKLLAPKASGLGVRNRVTAPGWPADSFFAYQIEGKWEGVFNRLSIITDRADQVVSVQFLCETPREPYVDYWEPTRSYKCYDYVLGKLKSNNRHAVAIRLGAPGQRGNLVIPRSESEWHMDPSASVARLAIELSDSGGARGYRALELNDWYVPRPLAALILQTIKTAPRGAL